MQQKNIFLHKVTSLVSFFLGVTTLFLVSPAAAHEWPNGKTITIVVPFAAGGFTDLAARRFANNLGTALNSSVIVQNKVGASGQIGTAFVAREKPDGYTLLVTATQQVIYPALQPDLPYNPKKDFSNIAILAYAPNVLLVPTKSPVSNLQEFSAYANKEKGGLAFGSSGVGGSAHLSGELFKLISSVNLRHVPYKSASPAVADLIGSQIPSAFLDASSTAAFIRSGELKAIAVTSKARLPTLPSVPTIAESGYPDYESQAWVGVFGPAGMPAAIVDKLNNIVLESNAEPATAKWFVDNNAIPATLKSAQVTEFIHSELDKWKKVITSANITAQ
ncbi:Bug family tripartite tricarboxylate transporter substrate binding protein [Comamonas sp. NoAH]|uniref:Bug family tripartite tricarboxylate transporter substrate binding protein n=1 Tax=Comamonas halotolerans TaxID=3041496 RepID=UPI0024E11C27|nr:tripartite tricarboxylate transporter substrate binding protein [Comamonas sp. NoAH]